MKIKSVRFEAFKSLYDVECTFEHLTVITGPNGAGKSNFVDALNFLGEVYSNGLEVAVSRAGGFENIAHRRSRRAKRSIGMTIEVEVSTTDLANGPLARSQNRGSKIDPEVNLTYIHSFSIRTASQSLRSDYKVEHDVLKLQDESGRTLFSLEKVGNRSKIFVTRSRSPLCDLVRDSLYPLADKQFLKFFRARPLDDASLVFEQTLFASLLMIMQRSIGAMRVFQLSPHQVRSTGVPTPNALLERHGENLPGAADFLRRHDKSGWNRVQSAMRTILPDLLEIEVVHTSDRRLTLQFRERNVGRPWSTGEVSDGTIQALALFVSLFDKRNPLLAIEEPENAIHPWILRQFIGLCMDAEGKQIILTTHSPVLLNYVSPEILRLMFMVNGKSQIKSFLELSPEVTQLILLGELAPFDIYDSGMLKESVPPGLLPGASLHEDRAAN